MKSILYFIFIIALYSNVDANTSIFENFNMETAFSVFISSFIVPLFWFIPFAIYWFFTPLDLYESTETELFNFAKSHEEKEILNYFLKTNIFKYLAIMYLKFVGIFLSI